VTSGSENQPGNSDPEDDAQQQPEKNPEALNGNGE